MARLDKLDYDSDLINPFLKSKMQYIEQNTGGWCPLPTMLLLNHICSNLLEPDEQYLEIGTFCGRSLVAAMLNNNIIAQVIDPFWDGAKVKEGFDKAVADFGDINRIKLHIEYCEKFKADLLKIGFMFYDGNHDSGHTYRALEQYEKYLADEAIILVDDYNIYGGSDQLVVKGFQLDIEKPVKTDVDNFVKDNPRFTLLAITPWGNGQAIISYNRHNYDTVMSRLLSNAPSFSGVTIDINN